MSVVGVADKTIEGIKSEHNFIVVNFANGDMVGHTGKLSAAVEARQAVDQQLNRVLVSASAEGYDVLITADHGNCEIMTDPISGGEFTEHTTSPVPFCYLEFTKKPFSNSLTATFSKEDLVAYGNQAPVSVLADISPTILEILELSKPKEMFGVSLLSTLS
jgi:2,3-bisphosphoglycerate-independent phosphoglycerate mutase